ncbi:dienelactone hydrolase family protein [Pontixanthobacter aestiaquae]|uniref:Dienelactone hydrolase family protein n=1 Tax=Pontixanthobacter aestiaquae TaxID=1509367 RepID=A0A844YZC6_9SPHN|nr:dienelactone hydrolase family protein [Pontixanthobacter aestiaquae]MDN3647204.1 dienelactone hydrolase family protein [Pontixanthobacter aestiaquae]MXO81821.1 dienelactone hydrolase family protein [Pontixanthobacter aestiaquae]
MCDDSTIEQEDAALKRMKLSRREFAARAGALGGAGAIAACAPTDANLAAPPEGTTVGRNVEFTSQDGTIDAFFVHPAGDEKHPGVILWPDIAGLREAYEITATRLAEAGYAVLAMNQYYRNAKAPVLGSFMEWRTDEGRAKLRPMINNLSSDAVMRDAKAAVAFLDAQDAVDTSRGVGSNGYCMGGPFTVYSTAAVPGRVKAAASFHGGGLVRDDDASPHRLMQTTQASYLFAIAEDDDAKAPNDKVELRTAADASGRPAEIEVYPAPHGWCTIDSPVYDKEQAERAWARMLVLFAGL